MPDVVLVGQSVQRLTRLRIALIGQLGVAVDGMVAAPLPARQTAVLPVPGTPSIRSYLTPIIPLLPLGHPVAFRPAFFFFFFFFFFF